MKTAILGSVLLLSIPFAALAAERDLYGTWKLVSLNSKVIDTGEMRQPRGKAPNGYVSFTPDGRVTGVIASEKRPKPERVGKMTDQQRIELCNTVKAYAGTYKLDGHKRTYRSDPPQHEPPEWAAA